MKIIEKLRYDKPELDAYVQEELQKIGKHIIVNAENYAVKNQPSPQNRKLQSYFEEDHLRYQALINTVNMKLQFKSLCNEVVEHDRLTEKRLRTLHNNQTAAKEEQIAIDAKMRTAKPPYSELRVLLVWLAIAIIALFEGLLACPVFETWGYNLIEALCMGVLFAGVLAAFSHVFGRIVLLGKTLWQRRTIALLLLLLLVALFIFMSITRAEYLSKQVIDNSADAINTHFSPLPFIATSLLLFIVAVAINHFFFPSTAERGAMRDYRQIKQEKQANEVEQEQIEQAIDATQQESADLKKINASILEFGCMLEQLIISNAYRGFSLWKKHNVMHRSDNSRPLSFDDPYPLNFDTNFHHLKSMIHESTK